MGDMKLIDIEGSDTEKEIVRTPGKAGRVWLTSLKFRDLQRLREAVRRVHMRYYPKDFVTLEEMDKIIESLGPETAEKLIKATVDNKLKGVLKTL